MYIPVLLERVVSELMGRPVAHDRNTVLGSRF